MPTQICTRCTTRLLIAYDFVQLAIDSEKKLSAFLEKTYNAFQEVITQNTNENQNDSDDEDILYDFIENDDGDDDDDDENGQFVSEQQEEELKQENFTSKFIVKVQNSELLQVSNNLLVNELELENETKTEIYVKDTISSLHTEVKDVIQDAADELYAEHQFKRPWCSICKSDFSTRTNLTRHMRKHANNKQFQCQTCGKGFLQKSSLTQHIYTHTGEKPFVCDICKRGFTQLKTLVCHKRRHTGEKPFPCEFCGTLFRQKDGLKMHILKHHVAEQNHEDDLLQKSSAASTFSCIICIENFENKDELKQHMRKHINNRSQNQQTNNLSTSKCETVEEIIGSIDVVGATNNRVRKYQCPKCFKSFAIESNLIEHINMHDYAGVANRLS